MAARAFAAASLLLSLARALSAAGPLGGVAGLSMESAVPDPVAGAPHALPMGRGLDSPEGTSGRTAPAGVGVRRPHVAPAVSARSARPQHAAADLHAGPL